MNTLQNKSSGIPGGRRRSPARTLMVRFKLVLCIVLLILAIGNQKILGQGVGISELAPITPHASSLLELQSTTKGLLAPRMSTAQRTAIASPAPGLLVYDTDTKSFWYYDAGWKAFASQAWGTSNQLLGMNNAGNANEYKTLQGTANRVIVTFNPNLITLSTPQDIAPISSPTFAGLTLTSPLTVPNGGTGLTSGISGGIPYFITNTSMASSALLTANGVVVGGGPGTAPFTILPGTNNTVLRGTTGGAPSFGQVVNGDIASGTIDLTSKVTGVLPILNGGTGSNTQNWVDLTTNQTANGIKSWENLGIFNAGITALGGAINLNNNSNNPTNINTGSSTSNVTIGGANNSLFLPKFTTAGVLHNDATGLVTSGPITLTTDLTGILPLANGGTNTDLSGGISVGDLLTGTTTGFTRLADIAAGNVLLSGGVGTAPLWGKVGLTSYVSGILPILNGGTNSGAALSGSSIMVSDGTAVVQGDKGTNTTVLHGNAAGVPTYGQVVTQDIADDAVTTSKILNANVTPVKIQPGLNNQVLVTDGTGAVAWINKDAFGAIADQVTIAGSGTTADPFKVKDLGIVTSKLADGAVTTVKIADDAVTTVKILDLNVTTNKLADNAVTSNKILDGEVKTADIADASVTAPKLTAGAGTAGRVGVADALGAITYGNIPAGSITGNNITSTDLIVTGGTGATLTAVTLDIANNAITNAKMADNAIGTPELQDNAVTTAKILDANVTTSKLADASVTTSKIADANVTVAKLRTSGAADAGKIYATDVAGVPILIPLSTFTSSNLPNGQIFIGDAANTAAGHFVSGDATLTNTGVLTISDNAITTSKILDTNVTTTKLADNAVTSVKIADGTIVNADIAAGAAIDATKLIDGSVSNTELGYINSLTSNAQTQIDSKANISGQVFTGAISATNLSGTNTGDVTLAGQNYLSLLGQVITANPIDLSGTNATGTLAAGRFPALTGDVTTTAGSLATTISPNVVTYGKMQAVSTTSRLLGSSSTTTAVQEITLGSGLTLTGNTLTSDGLGGTVTSVGLSLPSFITVTNSPVTGSGVLIGTLASQSANTVFAAPDGSAGTPIFRTLVGADIPGLDWTKIITGKPTTLAGYGITDAALATHSHTIDGLSNVTITGKANNDILQWNGSAWVNKTLTGAGIITSETDPIVKAINGIVKSNGTTISAAVAGTDYVAPNAAIIAGTNTKITYDAKGLVTAGSSAVLASADYAGQGTTTQVLHGGGAGNPSWNQIVNTDIDPTAGIVDTKLETISTAGKVSNSATTATSANTANTIVLRDATGNFSAGTISATLSGNATSATTAISATTAGTATNLAGGSLGTIPYQSGTGASSMLPVGTAGQILRSAGAAAPAWSTATYPGTTAINRLLYSSSANTVSEVATANNGILITSSGGVPSIGNTVGAALTMPSINLSANSNQMVLQSAGVSGTISWTPTTTNKTITFPDASGTVALADAVAKWAVNGNGGTNPVNDFIGTTDNNDLVFRVNNTERARLVSSNGDIKIGDAVSGTVRSSHELILREDGDLNGSSILRLRNRTAENGAIFETVPTGGENLVDFIFRTSDGGSGTIQRNIRFEARAAMAKTGTPSFHIGGPIPDVPTISIGDEYVAFNKGVRIGNYPSGTVPIPAPTALLHLNGGTAAAGTAPLKFTAGTNLLTPENGAVEYDGTDYWVTSGGTQYRLARTLTGTGNLSFGNTPSQRSSDLPITVTGAVVGDVVALGIPISAIINNTNYTAWVSAANTVTVRFNNYSSGPIAPPSGNFRVSVIRY